MLVERFGDFTEIRWRSGRAGNVDDTTAALGHGVNVDGRMGAGVAKQIRDLYGEEMFDDYVFSCRSGLLRPGRAILYWPAGTGLAPLVHLASQDRPGPHAKIGWVHDSVVHAGQMLRRRGVHHLALPRIGCGIGGLDWAEVKPVLDRASWQVQIDIEVWALPDSLVGPPQHIPTQMSGEPPAAPRPPAGATS